VLGHSADAQRVACKGSQRNEVVVSENTPLYIYFDAAAGETRYYCEAVVQEDSGIDRLCQAEVPEAERSHHGGSDVEDTHSRRHLDHYSKT